MKEQIVQEKYIKRIRDLREDNDKTQQNIADVLGTSQTMYARYERGANELPIHHLITLCNYYKVSADYILGLDEQPNQRLSLTQILKKSISHAADSMPPTKKQTDCD